ncbi:MAG: radical SAM protein [Anaerolineae bacterium]
MAPSQVATHSQHFQPGYLALLERMVLQERVRQSYELLAACMLCPRRCRVNRLEDQRGACHTGLYPIVASYGPHFGEEAPLVGSGGSGTIFFSGCNLNCSYCQNYEISQFVEGEETTPQAIASMMLELQVRGCHNINLVSPTHVVPQVLAAVALAAQSGLRLPIVYNTGGYDAPRAMRLLDGVVDIYMPDAKYASSEIAQRLSGIKQYAAVNRAMIREAYRQVGSLRINRQGVAERGLLVRHLVLPNSLAGSEEVMAFLAREISIHTYVNVMDQYRPCYRASSDALLARRLTREEYRAAVAAARAVGLYRLDGYWQP